jgi:hypothetical protein
MKPLVQKALQLAAAQIGTREIGSSNTGAEVSKWLRQTGVTPGNPWCLAFEYSMIDDAANALGVKNPMPRTAYTPDLGNFARERSILIPCIGPGGVVNLPQPGDVFLVRNSVRFHHTGFVQSATPDGFWKIEGNSNSNGSAEGYEVARNFGIYASRYWWVRYSVLCEEELTRVLYLGGHKVADLPVRQNITYAPVRKWCTWMRAKLEWVAKSDTPIQINGAPLEAEIAFYDSSAYVPLRALTALDPTLAVAFDGKAQAVYVTRAKAAR